MSQPGDADEREADRVAEQVVQRQAGSCHCGGTCAECSSPAEALVRRKAEPGGTPRTGGSRLLEGLSSGEALDRRAREGFEARFGHDLGDVRIHRDAAAADATRRVSALAFTVGRDVVFAPGRYAPGTLDGDRLLAHELTHVAQQRARDDGAGLLLQRVGVGETLARLFGEGTFDDAELQAYLTYLDQHRSAAKRIEDDYDSDNKARAVVRRWQRGDSLYILTPMRKVQLIEEMLSGAAWDADERAILDLLGGTGDAELTQILREVGEGRLRRAFDGDEYDELDRLLASRRAAAPTDPRARAAQERAAARETFSPETVLGAQQRFGSNAVLERNVRQNCIEIVRTIVPQLFAHDPALAQRIQGALGLLHGQTLTMEHAGRELTRLGVATGPTEVRFDNGNGNNEPHAALASAWDTIIGLVGNVQGWHIFGLALFDGFHSVTVFVDNRPDGPRVYWADQWAIDPGDDFRQQAGSISGFRRYERAGFDQWITEYTRSRWNQVHSPDSECGKRATRNGRNWDHSCRYDATLKIWKFNTGAP